MQCNIITIADYTAKRLRDGFGINKDGNLFLVISKINIESTKLYPIFTFTKKGIIVTISKINIEEKYFIKFNEHTSQLIVKDIHFDIVNKMTELFKKITPEKKGAFIYTGYSMNSLIQGLIQYTYKQIELYLKNRTNFKVSRKGVNLKYRGYGNFCEHVCNYNSNNDKTLVIWVFFYYLLNL